MGNKKDSQSSQTALAITANVTCKISAVASRGGDLSSAMSLYRLLLSLHSFVDTLIRWPLGLTLLFFASAGLGHINFHPTTSGARGGALDLGIEGLMIPFISF